MSKKQKAKEQFGRQSFEVDGRKFHAYANFCWKHQKNGIEILIQRQDTYEPVTYWWYVSWGEGLAEDGTFHADDFKRATSVAVAFAKQKEASLK